MIYCVRTNIPYNEVYARKTERGILKVIEKAANLAYDDNVQVRVIKRLKEKLLVHVFGNNINRTYNVNVIDENAFNETYKLYFMTICHPLLNKQVI